MAFDDFSISSKGQDRVDHDIFISYSRRDQDFVRKLYTVLTQANQKVWVDWEDIPAIADWRSEIYTSIEAANNFIFVISPNSICSEVCNEELLYAIQHNKRLVPIVQQSVDPKAVHPEIAKLNWIFFRESDDFGQALQVLIHAIETDLSHVRTHTRLLVRAKEWESKERDNSFLLRGTDLEDAERWLAQGAHKAPQPIALQQEYISTSHRLEAERREAEITLRRLTPQQYRNRQALLSKVKNFWVKNVLETSLHGRALIALGMEERFDVISHPWDITWGTSHESQQTLPPDTKAVDLFDQLGSGRSLLILGDPGAGKTTTLLELARDLIARAEQDIDQLIPVVFNLSSWASDKQTIARWLVEELSTKYQVPKKIGEVWVNEQQLLLLLDGLDEVRLELRDACVHALNEFSQQYGSEMVVCSRIRDYEALSQQLQSQGAICIQPLTLKQMDQYLGSAGSALVTVRTLLQEDDALQELAKSPLMLSIMTLAYQGVRIEDLPRGNLEASRKHLFSTYVQRMLHRRGGQKPYTSEQTQRWLNWLAQQMSQQSQTVFLIERIQPSWLQPKKIQTWLYHLGLGLILGPLVALLVSQTLEWTIKTIGLGFSWLNVLVGGLSAGLLWALAFACFRDLIFKPIGRLYLGAIGGIFWALMNLVAGQPFTLCFLYGTTYGLLLGLSAAFVSDRINPVETLKWSWSNAKRKLLDGLRWGLLLGFVSGLMLGLIDSLRLGLMFRTLTTGEMEPTFVGVNLTDRFIFALILILIDGLAFGLILEVLGGLIWGLIGGFSGTEIETSTTPNQGIWQSIRIATIQAAIGGLCLGSASALLGTPILAGGLLGLLFGLLGAGLACMMHGILRLILCLSGVIPWNYARFLNYATECVLLQKVGGGYIFIHRLLLEHFAALPLAQKSN